MRQEILQISKDFRRYIVPQIFSQKYRWIDQHKMFFTDGSKLDGSTGFGVYNTRHTTIHKLKEPCSVYVAELAAIIYTLEFIETLPPDHYFIISDSLSSIEAIRSMKLAKHSSHFLHRILEKLSALAKNNYRITLVWVPSHCSIQGNEEADSLAKVGAKEGNIFERIINFDEYYSIIHQRTLENWQKSWNEGELGRWCYSINPKVKTEPWFKGLNLNRSFIQTISRLMSNHYALDAHFYRIGLAGSNVCSCGEGFLDIEHLVWSCPEYNCARSQLSVALEAISRRPGIPVRDVLASRDFSYLFAIEQFLKDIDKHI